MNRIVYQFMDSGAHIMCVTECEVTDNCIAQNIDRLRQLSQRYDNVQDFGNNEPDAMIEWAELEAMTGKRILL